MVDLAISIINYKTKELTSSCLDSILGKGGYNIWLVDNASKDGSVEFFKSKYPQVNLIESKTNLGFAGGHNLVLSNVDARYYLILNSDTEILDSTLNVMVKYMGNNLDVGIASCKVLNHDGTLQPNVGDIPMGSGLINWLFNLEIFGVKKPSFHRNDDGFYKEIHEVGWVSGSFMLVRREVFEKIGFLDEDYFMYFEDVEFCMRANYVGFKVMLVPSVTIKHLSGGSLDDPKYRQWSGELKGLNLYYKKQFGSLIGILIKILILFALILRVVAFTLIGKGEYAKTYAKVIFSI
ncbi:MAG: glycosyl transferase family 2 [Microgenomates group bacterium Gr01-1014_93]|nr:MAG: glycosyl transferase family 2 [Microgenomates group bacterium Gr01-1014_93]